MSNIALPKEIKFIPGQKPNQSLIVIEPLYPGYGTTIGNSLRRVFLSSLSGAAAIGVKIEGAQHEFMSLPNIKEDVLEIILNLKKLRFKLHSEEIVKLELDVHGEKEVTAADIKKSSEAEVINTDLVLAHITEMSGSLKMEIYVSAGRGYEMVESRPKRDKEIGYIEIDSIFSPILSVGVSVENVRVGKMTNWEKLILDILTDGSLAPEKAFRQVVEILIEQFKALMPEKEEKEEEAAAVMPGDKEEKEEKKKRGRKKKE